MIDVVSEKCQNGLRERDAGVMTENIDYKMRAVGRIWSRLGMVMNTMRVEEANENVMTGFGWIGVVIVSLGLKRI